MDLFQPGFSSWLNAPAHQQWLAAEGLRLLEFAKASKLPEGFGNLDERGRLPANAQAETMNTARMTHSFALAHIQGVPGCRELVEHGVGAGEVGAPAETGDGEEVLRRAHRSADGRGATGVAGDQGKRQSGQRRLMPCPFGGGEDALGEARDVVRGIRVALGFMAGEQIDRHGREARGLQGQLDWAGRLLERRVAMGVQA